MITGDLRKGRMDRSGGGWSENPPHNQQPLRQSYAPGWNPQSLGPGRLAAPPPSHLQRHLHHAPYLYPYPPLPSSSSLRPPGVEPAVSAPPSIYAPSLPPPPLSTNDDGYGRRSYLSYSYSAGQHSSHLHEGASGGGVDARGFAAVAYPTDSYAFAGAAITGCQSESEKMVPTTLDPVQRSIMQRNLYQHHIMGKKKFNKKPKVVQSAYCEVCKVDCNSQEVLNNHKLGKKHKKNLEKLKESFMPKASRPVEPVLQTGVDNGSNQAKRKVALVATDPGVKKKLILEGEEASSKSMSQTSGITKVAPSTSLTSKSTAAIGSLIQNTGNKKVNLVRKKGPASKEDLEVKKRNVLECGAAAEAVKVCSICNVVCNGEIVFGHHLMGKKHLTMVKKQQ